MTTTIGRTVLLCRDLDASAAFWSAAFGFRTLFRGESDGFPLLHVGPGDVRDPGLWLMPRPDGAEPGPLAGFPALVLYVDDLDAVLDRLARSGIEPHVPATTDPQSGDRFAHVRDVDGHQLILVRLGSGSQG